MFKRHRDTVVAYAVVAPWALVLAFPFYWMLWTALKTDQDLYNVENVPFSFDDGSPTLHNVRFLFEETQYAHWLWNTVLVGAVVVVITLVFAVPAGYALARLSGRWGQSLGVGDLPRLPRAADAAVPAAVAPDRRARPPGRPRVADPRLPVASRSRSRPGC